MMTRSAEKNKSPSAKLERLIDGHLERTGMYQNDYSRTDEASPALSPVRVLLVADGRSPTTWGWVDAARSAGVVVLGADGLLWPEHRLPAGDGGVPAGT